MSIRFNIKIVVAAIALVATPAVAEVISNRQVRVVTVGYADLNLTSAQGRERLQARVKKAAKAVCAYSGHDRPVNMTRDQRNCLRNALDDANQQIATATHRAFTRANLAAAASMPRSMQLAIDR